MKLLEITGEEFLQQGLDNGSMAHLVRDVDPGMGRMHSKFRQPDMRRLNQKLRNEEWVIADLPIRRLTAAQSSVNPDFRDSAANRRATDTDDYVYPCVVHFGDDFYIFDGHHRVADAVASGAQTVRCRVVDMNDTPVDPRQMMLPGTLQ